jgi:hypothetical protein
MFSSYGQSTVARSPARPAGTQGPAESVTEQKSAQGSIGSVCMAGTALVGGHQHVQQELKVL